MVNLPFADFSIGLSAVTPLSSDYVIGLRLGSTTNQRYSVGDVRLVVPNAATYGFAAAASAATNTTALNAALTANAIVHVQAPGVHLINGVITPPESSTLVLWPGVTIRLANGTVLGAMFSIENNNVTITGLVYGTATIDGNRDNNTGVNGINIAADVSDVIITNLRIIQHSEFGIRDEGANHTTIVGNQIYDTTDSSIAATYTTPATEYDGPFICDNFIDRIAEVPATIAGGGIIIHGDDDIGANVNNVIINRNFIYLPNDPGAPPENAIGVELFNCIGAVVNNNVISGGTESISVAANSRAATVVGNKCTDFNFIGIESDEGVSNTITGNAITTIYEFYDTDPTSPISCNNGQGTVVSGNNIVGIQRGVQVFSETGAIVGDNKITISEDGSAVFCQAATRPVVGINQYSQTSLGNGSAVTFQNCTGGALNGGFANGFDTVAEINSSAGISLTDYFVHLPVNTNCTTQFSMSLTGGTSWDNTSTVLRPGLGNVANIQIPSTGFTVTVAEPTAHQILNSSTTLASGTLTMKAAPLPGEMVTLRSASTITTLTVAANAGQTITGAPTTFTAGAAPISGIYDFATARWYF